MTVAALYGTCAAALLLSVSMAPLRALVNNRLLRVYAASAALLLLLWYLRVGEGGPSTSLHFLAVSALTVTFGWSLAVLAASVVASAFLLGGGESLTTLPVSLLASVIAPATATYLLCRLVDACLPRNPFVFIFSCAFFGGVVSGLANVPFKSSLLHLLGQNMSMNLDSQPLAFLSLFALPEGVLNGMLITVLVILRPNWLRAYRDPQSVSQR